MARHGAGLRSLSPLLTVGRLTHPCSKDTCLAAAILQPHTTTLLAPSLVQATRSDETKHGCCWC
eukprot:m.479066 g.479066  ORF g.479066 m.479066 type:complete len:64 (-) comp21311_c0_seq1:1502-1693(-)